MKQWRDLLQDHEKTRDEDSYADTPVSAEQVYEQFGEEEYREARAMLADMSTVSLKLSFCNELSGDVPRETEKYVRAFHDSNQDAKKYWEEIRQSIETIPAYDDDFLR